MIITLQQPPTFVPTAYPTPAPSTNPSPAPTHQPSSPTMLPSVNPTPAPSTKPSPVPTQQPSSPTMLPSVNPTLAPSTNPSPVPTLQPSTAFPTNFIVNEVFSASLTGNVQSFTVPVGYSFITIYAYGAQGGKCTTCNGSPVGGLGGVVEATVSVTPGQVLFVYVGGMGLGSPSGTSDAGGYNGGGSGDTLSGKRMIKKSGGERGNVLTRYKQLTLTNSHTISLSLCI